LLFIHQVPVWQKANLSPHDIGRHFAYFNIMTFSNTKIQLRHRLAKPPKQCLKDRNDMKNGILIDDCCQGITIEERKLLRQLFDGTFKETREAPWTVVSQTSNEGG